MSHIHGGNINYYSQKHGLKNEEIIDFSANINFLGPPVQLKKYINSNFNMIRHYPEPNSGQLKKLLGNRLNLPPKNTIIGNGAVELIYQLIKVVKPKKSLMIAPTFSEYEIACKSSGAEIRRIFLKKENGFKYIPGKIIASLTGVDMVFVCNPNNPTGSLLNSDEIEDICLECRKRDIITVIDESFIDFLGDSEDYTIFKSINDYDNLFILRSLTKFYAIPGLRLGYGLGNSYLIQEMEEKRDPWSVNTIAQLAGEVIFNKKSIAAYRRNTVKANSLEKDYFYQGLTEVKGIKPIKPVANFILVNIEGTGLSSKDLSNTIAEKGILIRDCSSFSDLGEDYIRLAVKKREDNMKLIKVFKEILQE